MGGTASVWRAVDESTGQTVAVKRLHPHLLADGAARSRLEREARAMAGIRHPNVVGVREIVLDGDDPALVMDFVDGRSVAARGADAGPMDASTAVAAAAAIADGLAAAHAVGVVHRDVKPGNVLLGADGIPRLTDFGIAVDLEDGTDLTAADGVVGTLRYLAPERLLGRAADQATDVWGLGAVLHELLTGKPPFAAPTVEDRVRGAAMTVTRPAGLDNATWWVLATSLAPDPRDRYPDGATLAQALHALPGVPAPMVGVVGDAAPTELVAVPTVRAPSGPMAAAVDQAPGVPPAARPEVVAAPPRPAWAIVAVLAGLALVVGISMAAGADRGSAADLMPTTGPTLTAAPAESTPVAVESARNDGGNNGSVKADGKGNGKGNGKGKKPKD
jgi:serine/threonine protein kinase